MPSFDTPVLLIIFNRPQKVRVLIDALTKVQPRHIYIMADGPRSNVSADIENCQLARTIALQIPWECKVHTKFLEENIGCDLAVPIGIDWFFENVEEGIILEDDCIPNPTFFSFCAELLEYYRGNKEVMHISGNNFQDGQTYGDGSYYFSNYSHSWGWATWKRAWQHYHTAVADFPAYEQANRINEIPLIKLAKKFWLKHLRNAHNWDSRWMYTTWYMNGVCITPNVNLVSNIGFDDSATHTTADGPLANIEAKEVNIIIHPTQMSVNTDADTQVFKSTFYRPLYIKILNALNRVKIGLFAIHEDNQPTSQK